MGKRNHGKKNKNKKKESFTTKNPEVHTKNSNEEGDDKKKKSFPAKNPEVHTENSNELEDRFSELPDSLILYILSLTVNRGSSIDNFQTSKEVVKTCVLSKRWQFLWTGMSEIDLYESSRNMDKTRRFVSLVERVLDMCRVNLLHRFSVGVSYDECYTQNLDSWVQIAVERNVKDISLTSYGCMRRCYKLPQILYSHSSLTFLSVSCLAMTPRETIIWQCLKSLSITEVDLSDCVMEEIFTGYPVLEALCLKQCSGFTCLNIYSTTFTKLEIEIRAYYTPTIDILAPYARELKIKSAGEPEIHWYARWREKLTQFRLRDITSLVRASLDFYMIATPSTQSYLVELLQSLQYVKELDLGDSCIQYMFNSLSKVADLNIPPCSQRHLKLDLGLDKSFHGIFRILKSFPYLETLIIEGHSFSRSEDLSDNRCSYKDLTFNHLKTVSIDLPRGHEVMALAKILLKSANVLQKINLRFEPFNWEVSKELTKDMLALPRSSPEAIVVVDYCLDFF